MNQKITILGAGSSGMATAAWLTSEGHEVTLWDSKDQAVDFDLIRKQGGIKVDGGSGMNGVIMPHRLTTNLEEAIADTCYIIICTSASRHEEISNLCVPFVKDGQIFLFTPGNFGSFILKNYVEKTGKKNIIIAETSGCLWACRRTAPAQVLVVSPMKKNVKVAALPSSDNGDMVQKLQSILPVEAAGNVFEASLNSPNVVSHVAGAVLNVAAVERKGKDFAFFLDGLSASVITCFNKLEEERNFLMQKLGFKVYNPSSEKFMNMLMDYGNHKELDLFRSLDGPSSFSHRYVSEDAACGMAMLVSLGRRFKVNMPVTESFLTIAQAINHTDYLAEGRTLEKFGIDETDPEKLKEHL